MWSARIPVREKTDETVILHSGLRVLLLWHRPGAGIRRGQGGREREKEEGKWLWASLTSPTGIVENLFWAERTWSGVGLEPGWTSFSPWGISRTLLHPLPVVPLWSSPGHSASLLLPATHLPFPHPSFWGLSISHPSPTHGNHQAPKYRLSHHRLPGTWHTWSGDRGPSLERGAGMERGCEEQPQAQEGRAPPPVGGQNNPLGVALKGHSRHQSWRSPQQGAPRFRKGGEQATLGAPGEGCQRGPERWAGRSPGSPGR